MLKVLVVDDEFIVRAGLISCINWEEMNLDLIGEASNGHEALDIILKETPDIILLDLLMPVMTGMELIQKLEDLNIKSNIVILSCHEDYNYVREAFKKGVRDYILKLSSTPEEICSVLKDVVKKILDESASPGPSSVAYVKADIEKSPCQIAPLDNGYYLICFYGDSLAKKDNELILSLSLEWIQSAPTGKYMYTACLINESVPSVIAVPTVPDKSLHINDQKLLSETKQLYSCLKHFIDAPLYIGISSYSPCDKPFSKSMKESRKALDTLFYNNTGHIGFYSQLSTLFKEKESSHIFLPKISELIKHQHFPALLTQVEAYLAWANKTQPDPRIIKLDSIDVVNALNNHLKDKNLSLEDIDEDSLYYYQHIANMHTFQELQSYLTDFIMTYIQFLQDKGQKNIRNDVLEALKYIEEHYSDDISLPDVADYICISKNHLSYLFKKETGKTFSDYLIQYRIDKAKDFLTSETKLTVSDIAEKTGFHDTGYFSKVFKKATGLSPNQYKKGLP